MAVNTHCLSLNIDWLNSPLIVTHSRSGVNRAKANSITRWSPTWNWSYSKTLIYIPYKTLPDSEGLLRFSYLSQLPRKSLSSVSISVIHMWLISFEENSGDQNCHHFNDSKMNNVPNIHYEHYKPQIFFSMCLHKHSGVEYVSLNTSDLTKDTFLILFNSYNSVAHESQHFK